MCVFFLLRSLLSDKENILLTGEVADQGGDDDEDDEDDDEDEGNGNGPQQSTSINVNDLCYTGKMWRTQESVYSKGCQPKVVPLEQMNGIWIW